MSRATTPGSKPARELAHQFLVHCLQARWDPSLLGVAQELVQRQHFDGGAVLRAARVEGVAPLVYQAVRGKEIVPVQEELALRRAYEHAALRNTFLFHQLEAVLHRFEAEGVEVMLLKGAALSRTVYGSAAVRPLGDLDLLVRAADVDLALQLLWSDGYRTTSGELPRARDVIPHTNQVMLFRRNQLETLIEVHWHLFWFPFYRVSVPMEWIWDTALHTNFGEAPAWLLSPEALLLHLCAHTVQHESRLGHYRLLWIQDIVELLTRYETQINWVLLLSRARGFRLLLPLRHVLGHLTRDWPASIPPKVLRQLDDLCPEEREEKAYAQFVNVSGCAEAHSWASLRSLPSLRSRVRFALRVLFFPSAGYMRIRYRPKHPALTAFYYPYRWIAGLRHALSSSRKRPA